MPATPSSAATAPGGSKAVVQFASCAKPEYPAQALANRQTGTVKLGFLVDKNGKVLDARVDRSSGDVALDDAARLAIAKCTFTPAMDNGIAMQSWAPVQYVWALQ